MQRDFFSRQLRLARVMARAAAFRRDEGGSMIIFGLFLLVMMLIVSGMAIDVMRTEHTRVRLQNTLDRAVLAAADLDQQLDPASVVEDYFAKANLSQYLNGVTVNEGLNFREVSADVSAQVPSMFLKLLGINYLTAPAQGSAEESVSDIDVVMVLDLSNSMNSLNRLPDLKDAAEEFVDTVLMNEDVQERISISLVPYTGQVSVGQPLLSYYNVTGTHTFGMCVNFPSSAYTQTGLSQATAIPRADLFDPWHTSQSHEMTYCPTHASQAIMPYQNNPTTLKTRIRSFIADGNTSIDFGMKWGVALLDPTFRPVVNGMVGTGHIPAVFQDRPFDYGVPRTAKYIVLMSDGENWFEYSIKSPYNSGLSNVYYRASDNRFSVYHSSRSGSRKYWYPHNSSWNTGPYGGGAAVQLTWPEVWSRATVRWVAQRLFATPLGHSTTTWVNNFLAEQHWDVKDTRLSAMCATARNAGITIYTIGFMATDRGNESLEDCASSPSHFFNVDNTNIDDAFRAIARQISQLRLTL